MKTKLSLLILVALLLLAVPTAVAARPQPVGGRISIHPASPGPDTWPAGLEFHIAHGWRFDPPSDLPHGLFSFALEVDGVSWEEDYVDRGSGPDATGTVIFSWVHNFPEGMPVGQVTFTGHWYGPCRLVRDPAECDRPNEIVEALTNSLTVTFFED